MIYAKRAMVMAAGYILPLALLVPTYRIASYSLEQHDFLIFLVVNTIYGFSVLLDGGIGRATAIIFRKGVDPSDEKTVLFNALVASILMFTAITTLLLLIAAAVVNVFGVGYGSGRISLAVLPQLYIGVLATVVFLSLSAYLEAKLDFISALYARLLFTGSYYVTLIVGFAIGQSIGTVFLFVAITRVLVLAILAWTICGVRVPHLSLESRYLRSLAKLGLPIFLANIPGITIAFLERLAPVNLVGSPTSSLATYLATIDVLGKASIAPVAVNRAVFPEIASHGIFQARRGFFFALSTMVALGATAVLASFWLTPMIYQAWILFEVSEMDHIVIVIMSASWAFNVIGQVFFSALQASRRSYELSALQFVELIFFVLLFLYLASKYGIVGVATASLLRAMFDAAGLLILSAREMRRSSAFTLFGFTERS